MYILEKNELDLSLSFYMSILFIVQAVKIDSSYSQIVITERSKSDYEQPRCVYAGLRRESEIKYFLAILVILWFFSYIYLLIMVGLAWLKPAKRLEYVFKAQEYNKEHFLKIPFGKNLLF
jgi:hypothetical protein